MILLEEFQSEALHLKNRVIMAPMTRSRATNKGTIPNDLMATYYTQRASAGLIISEGTFISPEAIGYIHVPGIYTKEQIEGWKKITKAVHDKGGKIFAQLWHVGRISHPDLLEGKTPLAPSAINPHHKSYTHNGFVDTLTPKAMSLKEIHQTISDFQQAAVNAVKAGFDGVELHAANGYLFHQFFAKCSNTRTDQYGGSIENRGRFLFEVLNAISKKIDLSKVGVRLAPELTGTFGMEKDDETEAMFDYLAHKLNDYSLAYLHLSGFTKASTKNEMKLILDSAAHFRKIYHGTLMINKGFNRDTANKAIEDKTTDLVSFGELFISNPDLVERFSLNASLNEPNRSTYYSSGAEGYTDYPRYISKH